MRMLKEEAEKRRGGNLEKEKDREYIVEREFRGQFSVKELLIRIIKTHIENEAQKQ